MNETVNKLVMAAQFGREDEVKRLLDAGADPNGKEEGTGWTALHYAAHHAKQGGYPEIVRLLVERGADVNAKAKDGTTVLAVAIEGEAGIGTLEFLDAHGAVR